MKLPPDDPRACDKSPSGLHYRLMTEVVGTYSNVRTRCVMCNGFIKIQGALWALDETIIVEEEVIEDYL